MITVLCSKLDAWLTGMEIRPARDADFLAPRPSKIKSYMKLLLLDAQRRCLVYYVDYV